jgi:hypothetical protein
VKLWVRILVSFLMALLCYVAMASDVSLVQVHRHAGKKSVLFGILAFLIFALLVIALG